MRLQTKIIIICFNISFILSTSNNVLSNEGLEQINKEIKKYSKTCKSSNNIQKIGFEPFKKKEDVGKKGFAYEITGESYNGEFTIGDVRFKDEIWFYSNIKSDKGKAPKYIWHLIISPIPKEPQKDIAEAFLVNFDSKNSIDKLNLLQEFDEELIQLSTAFESDPVIYTNNELDGQDRLNLDNIWRMLLNKNMELVLLERIRRTAARNTNSTEKIKGYDYTFYLHEIDCKPEEINLDHGYRIVSSKTITSPGQVYGFVLNEDGSCLGYEEITAK
jgi:hypothetical protein